MNKHIFSVIFGIGALIVGWIGIGFVGSNWLALMMTALIAVVYGIGAFELLQFRQATASMSVALAAIPANLTQLNEWLDRLHPTLQNPVRWRIEGERSGLPGPALTPYLVGLLVLLGMLGTFIGMVVTLNGAVFALQGMTDLQAIRTALAAPIKGLSLAFGTSVAGVAASAMLGLLSALSRRERQQMAQRLDSRIATTLRPFSLTYQRQETFKALQLQAHTLPMVAEQLQVMMRQLECNSQEANADLLVNQERFHRDTRAVYSELAASVAQSLSTGLTAQVQAASEMLNPLIKRTLTEMAGEARVMHEKLVATTHQQLRELTTQASATLTDTGQALLQQVQADARETLREIRQLLETAAQAPRAATEVIGQLRQEMSNSMVHDNVLLEERQLIMAKLTTMLDVLDQASREQRQAIETLVAGADASLQGIGQQFVAQVRDESAKMSEVTAQVGSGAIEIASLGETFGFAVQRFNEANEKLITSLQRIESAMDESLRRSDEQLAYYVAQAREIIDLSILSQQEAMAELRQQTRRPAALEEVVG
jgi:hypothetical protein